MNNQIKSFMKDELGLIYERMGEFAKRAFPEATSIDHLNKLKHEANETIETPNDISEYADCLLCLFGAASKAGFAYHELREATRQKLFIVENRQWNRLPDGTYQHTPNNPTLKNK